MNKTLLKSIITVILVFIFAYIIVNITNGTLKYLNDIDVTEKQLLEYEKQIAIDNQNDILDCLAFLETNNKNIIVLDSNNKFSYGIYQFQINPLKDIYPKLSDKELVSIAMNPTSSREIARDLIFNKKQYYKWGNSFSKMEKGKCPNLEIDLLNNIY